MGESFSTIQPGPACELTFAAVSQTVTDADFVLFQRMIEKYAGIYLSPAKKPLLIGRLSRRLRQLGLTNLHQYYKRVTSDPDEHVRMMDCISTNETQFFREPLHFEYLEKRILPQWIEEADAGRRPRRVRVWSAGCSSGEEPYSIAMTLLSHLLPAAGWQVEIVATDISTRVLARARAGIWPLEKARQIPEARLRAFMLRGTGSQQGNMKASPELQSVIRFERLNLMEDPSTVLSSGLDIIFCRNVLIYFQPETKEKVLRRLLRHLAPNGYLFVGHSESLNHLADCVRSVIPTVYIRSNPFTEC